MGKKVPAPINGYGLKSNSLKKFKSSNHSACCGSGDYYGSAIRNPVGKIRYDSISGEDGERKKSRPPRSLA